MTDAWTYTAGVLPHKVTAFENLERGGVAYLKWRAKDARGHANWQVESLKDKLRTANGRIIQSVADRAIRAADLKYAGRVAGLEPAARVKESPVTLLQGLALFCDPETGRFPGSTPYRKEVQRSLNHAARILGDIPFNHIRREHLRKLYRRRHAELVERGEIGVRGAEVVVSQVLAVAEWLRGDDKITEGACRAWKDWKVEMANEAGSPEPFRPRHTIEQARAIIPAAWEVDPRLGLAIALGAELRGGQVIRCRRSDLDLEAWTLKVGGRGKKRGTVVHLTRGQREAVERALAGYLAPLEAAALDYPLFPAGRMAGYRAEGGKKQNGRRRGHRLVRDGEPRASARHAAGGHVNRSSLDDWFMEAERIAGVPHVPGRSWYGLRRVLLDAATEEGISPEGLQEHGGWADTQVPERIYRDKERVKAREEARDVRARIRGEGA